MLDGVAELRPLTFLACARPSLTGDDLGARIAYIDQVYFEIEGLLTRREVAISTSMTVVIQSEYLLMVSQVVTDRLYQPAERISWPEQ